MPQPGLTPKANVILAPAQARCYTDFVYHWFGEMQVEQQNVTIALPADLLKEAKHLAVDRGVSLSRYVAMLLEERVQATREYRAARDRQRELLRTGLPLGTGGLANWPRDELHER